MLAVPCENHFLLGGSVLLSWGISSMLLLKKKQNSKAIFVLSCVLHHPFQSLVIFLTLPCIPYSVPMAKNQQKWETHTLHAGILEGLLKIFFRRPSPKGNLWIKEASPASQKMPSLKGWRTSERNEGQTELRHDHWKKTFQLVLMVHQLGMGVMMGDGTADFKIPSSAF